MENNTKKLLLLIACLASLTVTAFLVKTAKAPVQEIVPETIPEAPKTPRELVTQYAKEYKVSEPLMVELINLENKPWDVDLQSYSRYPRDNTKWGVVAGEREKSFGLAMIHLPDHPTITYEQATNPDFAIKFIAREISAGRGWQWSCYNLAKSNVAQGKSGGKCS